MPRWKESVPAATIESTVASDRNTARDFVFPHNLLRSLHSGEAVLWLGAGIGVAWGRPSWEGLLRQVVREHAGAARPMLDELIDQGRLHSVFTYVHRHLGGDPIADLLARLEQEPGPSPSPNLSRLGQLPWGACLTTTYPAITQSIFGGVAATSPKDVHHLTLRDATSMLLLRTPPTSRPMRLDAVLFDFIEELVHTRTIVFAGFELDDPDFAQILDLLDRIGRGHAHFALLALVSDAEAEDLRERHAIDVVHVGERLDWGRLAQALEDQPADIAASPGDCRTSLVALDLTRIVRMVPLRADLCLDQALVIDPRCIETTLDEIPSLGRVGPSALLRAGNVMLAHGRIGHARKCFQQVASTVVGREYLQLARFNLGWAALIEGDRSAAREAFVVCAEADPSLALLPPRFSIGTLRGVLGSQLFLTAHDRELRRDVDVLLTTLPRPVSGHERQRFLEHIERLQEVSHPALARVLGGTVDGRAFAMLYDAVPGFALADALESNLSLERAVELLSPIIAALELCHRRDIVHGNLGPYRLLIGPQGPVLVGFGVSPIAGWERPAVREQCRGFLAPEVLAGHPPTPAADVFSLTALLYRCLTGQIPDGSVPPPSRVDDDLDPRLDALVAAGLHPDPEQRPPLDVLEAGLHRIVATPEVGRARRMVATATAPGHEDVVDLGRPATHAHDPVPEGAEDVSQGDMDRILQRYAEQPELPEHRVALDRLEALARRHGDPGRLARVLRARADHDPTSSERVARLQELARLYEHSLDNAEAAFDLVQVLLREVSVDERLGLLHGFRRLAAVCGRWKAYTDALLELAGELADPRARADLHAEAASLLRTELGDIEGAITCLRRSTMDAPDGERTMQLVAELEALGRKSEAAETLDALAQRQEGRERVCSSQRAACLWVECEPSRAFHSLCVAMLAAENDASTLAVLEEPVRALLERSPTDPEVLTLHAALLEALERWEALDEVARAVREGSFGTTAMLAYTLARASWRRGDVQATIELSSTAVRGGVPEARDVAVIVEAVRSLGAHADEDVLVAAAKLLHGVLRHRPRDTETLTLLQAVYERLERDAATSMVGSVRKFLGEDVAAANEQRFTASMMEPRAWSSWWERVYHPHEDPRWSRLFALLWPAVATCLGRTHPSPVAANEPHEEGDDAASLCLLVEQFCRYFDAPRPQVRLDGGDAARVVRVEIDVHTQEAEIRVAPSIAFSHRVLGFDQVQRYACAAWAVAASRPEHLIATLAPDEAALREVVAAAEEAFAPANGARAELEQALRCHVPEQGRAAMAKQLAALRPHDAGVAQWLRARSFTLARMMFVGCRDIDVTAALLDELAKDGPVDAAALLDDVLSFGVAEDSIALLAGVA